MRRKKTILGRIVAMFVALRDRWAGEMAEDVRSENERQLRLHRQIDEDEARSVQES